MKKEVINMFLRKKVNENKEIDKLYRNYQSYVEPGDTSDVISDRIKALFQKSSTIEEANRYYQFLAETDFFKKKQSDEIMNESEKICFLENINRCQNQTEYQILYLLANHFHLNDDKNTWGLENFKLLLECQNEEKEAIESYFQDYFLMTMPSDQFQGYYNLQLYAPTENVRIMTQDYVQKQASMNKVLWATKLLPYYNQFLEQMYEEPNESDKLEVETNYYTVLFGREEASCYPFLSPELQESIALRMQEPSISPALDQVLAKGKALFRPFFKKINDSMKN